jgi:hypothetical protein
MLLLLLALVLVPTLVREFRLPVPLSLKQHAQAQPDADKVAKEAQRGLGTKRLDVGVWPLSRLLFARYLWWRRGLQENPCGKGTP